MKHNIIEKLHNLKYNKLAESLNEADEDEEDKKGPDETDGEYSESESITYDSIKLALENELINHAAVIRALWGDSDATNRSLFKKKVDGAESESGSKYRVSETELGKITSILTTFRDDLGGALERKNEENE